MNLYSYVSNNPINWRDVFGLKHHNDEETQERLAEITEDLGSGIFNYFTMSVYLFRGGGKYDFKIREPNSTFTIDGKILNASQFGNYAVGYATTYQFGTPGYVGTRIGGDIFAQIELLFSIIIIPGTKTQLHHWMDDPGSVEMINKGMEDAYRDTHPDTQDVECTKTK